MIGKTNALVGGGGRNGLEWLKGNGLSGNTPTGLAYNGSRFVYTGVGVAYYSDDKGKNWSAATGVPQSRYFKAVAYGNSYFIACSMYSDIMYSSDGATWNGLGALDSTNTPSFNDITYGEGKFVLVGAGGNTWYATTPTTKSSWLKGTGLSADKSYNGIAQNNGRFVAVGDGGACAYSINGQTWTELSGQLTKDYRKVAYGNGRFIAIGDYGAVAYSINGQVWTELESLPSTFRAYDIAFGNAMFVAVGMYGKSAFTIDGTSWGYGTGLENNGVTQAVEYGDGFFVAVGSQAVGYADVRSEFLAGEAVYALEVGNDVAIALETKDGEVFPVLTATANDIRLETTAITDEGLTEGTKDIPAYHTRKGYVAVRPNTQFLIPLSDGDAYDFTAIQCIIAPWNTSIEDSVSADKVVIETSVYQVNSTTKLSDVVKDEVNKAIDLGITNGNTPYVIYFFTYKEEA